MFGKVLLSLGVILCAWLGIRWALSFYDPVTARNLDGLASISLPRSFQLSSYYGNEHASLLPLPKRMLLDHTINGTKIRWVWQSKTYTDWGGNKQVPFELILTLYSPKQPMETLAEYQDRIASTAEVHHGLIGEDFTGSEDSLFSEETEKWIQTNKAKHVRISFHRGGPMKKQDVEKLLEKVWASLEVHSEPLLAFLDQAGAYRKDEAKINARSVQQNLADFNKQLEEAKLPLLEPNTIVEHGPYVYGIRRSSSLFFVIRVGQSTMVVTDFFSYLHGQSSYSAGEVLGNELERILKYQRHDPSLAYYYKAFVSPNLKRPDALEKFQIKEMKGSIDSFLIRSRLPSGTTPDPGQSTIFWTNPEEPIWQTTKGKLEEPLRYFGENSVREILEVDPIDEIAYIGDRLGQGAKKESIFLVRIHQAEIPYHYYSVPTAQGGIFTVNSENDKFLIEVQAPRPGATLTVQKLE